MDNKQGFAAIISLLIISAVAMAIGLSVTLTSINSMNSSLTFAQGIEVDAIGQSCVDEALLRLRSDGTYTGGTLTVGNGSCTIGVTGTGSNRTITVTATLFVPPAYTATYVVTAKRAGGSIRIVTFTKP